MKWRLPGLKILGPVSRTSRELSGPEKPFVKVRPAYSAKLVFSYVVKGVKIKITAKFRASRLFRFEDTKRIMSPEIRPKSFGTFEKQAPGPVSRIFSPNKRAEQSLYSLSFFQPRVQKGARACASIVFSHFSKFSRGNLRSALRLKLSM